MPLDGPANLLYLEPTGYRATMVGFPYDDIDRWRGSYPAEAFAGQFEKVAPVKNIETAVGATERRAVQC